jgi:hypothetical protein
MKKCSICNQEKDTANFSKKSKNNDNLENWCKVCDKEKKEKYYSQDKIKLKEYHAKKYIEKKDERSEYAKRKYIEKKEERLIKAKVYYEKTKESKAEYDKQYREQNKLRIAEYKRQWAIDNPEKVFQKQKEYRESNSKELSIKKSQYAKNNRQKINAKASIYTKYRCDTDPLYKLIKNTRTMVSRYMLGEKSKRTQEIVGCSFEELKIYIENQFTEGMSWDNYGIDGWHVDHIKPLAVANSQEEIILLNHHSNLQPLWALDNLKKGATFDGVNYKTKQ